MYVHVVELHVYLYVLVVQVQAVEIGNIKCICISFFGSFVDTNLLNVTCIACFLYDVVY